MATGRSTAPGGGAVASTSDDGRPLVDTAADLGRLVRRRRDELRLSQLQLARAAGTGRRFVSELESGKPSLELGRVLSVCRALGIHLLAEIAGR